MRLPSLTGPRPTLTMPSTPHTGRHLTPKLLDHKLLATACLLGLTLHLGLIAQSVSALPPTAPTVIAPIAATPAPGPVATRPTRAQVQFSNGQLTVFANDSSLHQILRSISRSTGMTITGGVADQRVFGTYGPDAPATILATLLDGTGVNILYSAGNSSKPPNLVLTQRAGGATPAPITAADDININDLPPVAAQPAPNPPGPVQPQPAPAQASGPPSMPQPANNVLGSPANTTPTASQLPTTNSVPLDALPTPSTTTQTSQGIVDSANPPPAGSSAATPESIYQQLLQLQKAKSGASPAPPQ